MHCKFYSNDCNVAFCCRLKKIIDKNVEKEQFLKQILGTVSQGGMSSFVTSEVGGRMMDAAAGDTGGTAGIRTSPVGIGAFIDQISGRRDVNHARQNSGDSGFGNTNY